MSVFNNNSRFLISGTVYQYISMHANCAFPSSYGDMCTCIKLTLHTVTQLMFPSLNTPLKKSFPCRVEDHDDLTPIFNRQSDVLTSTYGMSSFLRVK